MPWLLPGPAYEAIQNVGEEAFRLSALEQARGQARGRPAAPGRDQCGRVRSP